MSCECDYEPPEAFSVETRTARKAHRCSECRRTIEPGERYRHVWGVWEGTPAIFKRCETCGELERWATSIVPCLCVGMGNLHGDILDEFHEHERDCPGLVAEAKEKITKIRATRREWQPEAKAA